MARGKGARLPQNAVEAVVEGLSHDGRGVARVEGKTVFIQGALVGERVSFRYRKSSRRFDEGVVEAVLQASPDRVVPKCAHFNLCGGCSLQHLSDQAQIRDKEHILLDALTHIGKVAPGEVLPPLVPASHWGYRKKARLGVKHVEKKGRVLVGFREKGSAFIAEISRCEVLDPLVGRRLDELSQLIGQLSIPAQIPQIEMAMGDQGCVLIFRTLARLSEADRAMLLEFGQRHDILMAEQPGGVDSIAPLRAGDRLELSYQLPEFQVEIQFQPTDFTQVNSDINRRMVKRAVEMLNPLGDERVLDLFCGLGNFTLPLARRAGQVVGVEGDAGLVERARRNAQLNGLENVSFHAANLYEDLNHAPWLQASYDKALLDPPRSGAAEVLRLLPVLGVRRAVYVSCYPATLARDAGTLVHEHGYRLVSAGVMDMFPHTGHVESIALFEK